MAKIDSHPWVKEYANHYKLGVRRYGAEQLNHEIPEIKHKLKAAREIARKYGSGHNMSAHGEGKKHGEK